jgi:hypothetical protein
MPPETVWLVRAEREDPLDKAVITVRMKDHCEYTAGWQLVPVEMEEMHTIYVRLLRGSAGSPGFDIGAPDELKGIIYLPSRSV